MFSITGLPAVFLTPTPSWQAPPDTAYKPASPALRWVFQGFEGINLIELMQVCDKKHRTTMLLGSYDLVACRIFNDFEYITVAGKQNTQPHKRRQMQ